MRYVVVGVLICLAASVRPVQATGLCENNPRHYDPPVRYSPTEKRLAFAGSQEFCDETEKPAGLPGVQGERGEERGTAHFIEIRDLKNVMVERLSSARGATVKRLNELVGKITTLPPGKMDAQLKARGFFTITATGKSPAGGCTVRTVWKNGDQSQNGFPAGNLTAEVWSGKKRIAVAELGVAAQTRHGEAALQALFLANEKTLLIWARVPQCAGGPPPGYFGQDDGGSCYASDDIAIQQLPMITHPELGRCFTLAPAAP